MGCLASLPVRVIKNTLECMMRMAQWICRLAHCRSFKVKFHLTRESKSNGHVNKRSNVDDILKQIIRSMIQSTVNSEYFWFTSKKVKHVEYEPRPNTYKVPQVNFR